jgi:NADPH-dependent 2,4-dienoyl-CoA reductase/sulfur reductase-like enzyme
MNYLETGVTVIGGGPAGMSAALSASREGAQVLLLERDNYLGGILNQCIHDGFGLIRFGKLLSGPEYAGIFIKEIEGDKNITPLLNTMVINTDPQNQLYCATRDGILCITSKAFVFATGCRERSRGAVTIPGTRPTGIYTAGVAQYLMNIRNIAIGKRAVILGSGDIGMIMARRLTLSGVKVECVLEKLPFCGGLPRNLSQCLEDYDIPLFLSRTVTEICGNKRIESVVVSHLDSDGSPIPDSEYTIPCDTLILSVGLIPENEILSKLNVELIQRTNSPLVNNHLETSESGVFVCGNALHVNDLVDNVSVEGEQAGRWAALHGMKKSLSKSSQILLKSGQGIRYSTPQKIYLNEEYSFSFRVEALGKNKTFRVSAGGTTLFEQSLEFVNPVEIISIKIPAYAGSEEKLLAEVL